MRSRRVVSEIDNTEVIEYLTSLLSTRGWPPSVAEVQDWFGITSKAEAFRLLRRVEEAGLIERVPGIPRAIRVIR